MDVNLKKETLTIAQANNIYNLLQTFRLINDDMESLQNSNENLTKWLSRLKIDLNFKC